MMNDNTLNIILPILKDFSFVVGMALFLVSLVIGLILMVQPAIIIRLNQQVGKRFSFRRSTKFLEKPNNVDRMFYRHHRIIGTIVTLTSAYVLYYFSLVYDPLVIADYVQGSGNAIALDLLINTLRLFMLVSSGFIVFIGMAIFVRPSWLKTVEVWANRWVSTRQASRSLAVERDQVNQLAYQYPRLAGLVIVVISLYASILLYLVYT